MNLVAGGEGCSSAGGIMLLMMAIFLLCTKMVRFSISIQPSKSPYGFTVARCTRAVFIKVREVNNDKIKKAEEPCCRQQDQMLFLGVVPAPMRSI